MCFGCHVVWGGELIGTYYRLCLCSRQVIGRQQASNSAEFCLCGLHQILCACCHGDANFRLRVHDIMSEHLNIYAKHFLGYSLASFPCLLRLQFLIACSMQKWREKLKAWGILTRDLWHGHHMSSRLLPTAK